MRSGNIAVRTPGRTALPLLLLLAGAVAVFGCLLCYQYDNKYTAFRPAVLSGAVVIDDRTLAEHPAVLLLGGWEIYGGRLLSPADFAHNPPAPDAVIYIGQHGGFEHVTPDGSPHGSATYRLLLELSDTPRSYTLELPEIFSAYRVYANGTLLAQMGDPEPKSYRPETRNSTVTFETAGRTEIVIAVSDFSHLYSGMVYPPAFGLPDAVSQLLSARFLFRALLCAMALTIGLLSLLVGILSRQLQSALLYGLLCLFFVGYAAYPLVKTFFGGYYPFYAFENFAFCAMLVTVGILLHGVSGIKGKPALAFPLFGALVCIASVVLHLLLAKQSPNLLPVMHAYSWLITVYEWITAAYLTFLSVRAVWKGAVHSKAILVGIVIFDAALVMDRILPLHEPIVTGWFSELASFALVLCIGAAVGASVAVQYRENAVLSERADGAERLLEMQRSYYTLLDEKMEDTRALRHDLRHHVSALHGFIAGKQYEELAAYLSGVGQNIDATAPKAYSDNRVVNVLANHYASLSARQGVRFELHCDLTQEVAVNDADLSALLCNLMENALEACARMGASERMEPGTHTDADKHRSASEHMESGAHTDADKHRSASEHMGSSERMESGEYTKSDMGFVRVSISHMGSTLNIRVANSADAGPASLAGKWIASLPNRVDAGIASLSGKQITPPARADAGLTFLSENRIASSKRDGRAGYGLYSIRMIVQKYNGQSEMAWDEANGVFTHSVTLFLSDAAHAPVIFPKSFSSG